MRHLAAINYPIADFEPIDFAPLPLRWFPYLRVIPNLLLIYIIQKNNKKLLEKLLQWYGVNPEIYSKCDVVMFNGEGAIHSKSGHFFRLIASLYAFKLNGKIVSAMNQTVDIPEKGIHATLLKLVFPKLDFVYTREPVSWELLNRLGINNTVLGDAAYALPKLSSLEVDELVGRFNLSNAFIAITGSSALDRSKSSLNKISAIVCQIIFLANTKTDVYLAEKLKKQHRIRIISYKQAGYKDAMAIISKARILVGGRQHPNIFAAIYHTPFIAFDGNTHAR